MICVIRVDVSALFVAEELSSEIGGLLRGTIVNRTYQYGIHKNRLVYIRPFLLSIFGPIYYGPP